MRAKKMEIDCNYRCRLHLKPVGKGFKTAPATKPLFVGKFVGMTEDGKALIEKQEFDWDIDPLAHDSTYQLMSKGKKAIQRTVVRKIPMRDVLEKVE